MCQGCVDVCHIFVTCVRCFSMCQGYRMLQTSDVSEISLCQRFVGYIRGVSGAPRNKNDKHVSNRMNRSDFLTAA